MGHNSHQSLRILLKNMILHFHITSSLKFLQSNWGVEKAVQTAKRLIKKNKDDIFLALLAYRTSPLEHGFSPGELLMNRKLRSTLPILPSKLEETPDIRSEFKEKEKRIKDKMEENYNRRHHVRDMDPLNDGNSVWIVDIRKYGKIVKICDKSRSYIVNTEVGQYRRNRWHLIYAPYHFPPNRDESPTPILSDGRLNNSYSIPPFRHPHDELTVTDSSPSVDSDTMGGRDNNVVKGVKVTGCEVTNSDNGIRIKTVYGATGSVSDITYQDITLSKIHKYGIVIEGDYENGSPTGTPTDGVPITGLTVKNVKGSVDSSGVNIYILVKKASDWHFSGISVSGGSKTKSCTGIPSDAGLTKIFLKMTRGLSIHSQGETAGVATPFQIDDTRKIARMTRGLAIHSQGETAGVATPFLIDETRKMPRMTRRLSIHSPGETAGVATPFLIDETRKMPRMTRRLSIHSKGETAGVATPFLIDEPEKCHE
ncbi:hypothetical protein NQ315_015337 [Exocentrus adspersus]|uniref:endo-polygalacturonase n=1 Tax=Exocentrus adspersus TaxID=1586481 RepID=A0AAV8VCC3_9CUCU|nr:hypothetical protein NQ315_015337 [Exocentrus adspersus]